MAAIAAAPDAAAARRWLRDLRDLRPLIDGDDLLAAGVEAGPRLGRALDRLRDAVLDGSVSTVDRDAQLRAALAAATDC